MAGGSWKVSCSRDSWPIKLSSSSQQHLDKRRLELCLIFSFFSLDKPENLSLPLSLPFTLSSSIRSVAAL